MSDTTFAILFTFATFAFLVMWVPFLDAFANSLRRAKVTAQTVGEQALSLYEPESIAG